MSEEREVVVVEHKPGEDKPWHISLEGAGFFDTGRAKLNFPKREFETQAEAEEVADKIRNLIKSDAVEVRDDEHRSASPDTSGIVPPVAGAAVGTAAGVGASSTSTSSWDEDDSPVSDVATGGVDEAPAATDENILSGVPDRDPLVEDDVLVDPDGNQVEVGTYGDVVVDEEEPVVSLVDEEPVVVPTDPAEGADETVGVESVPPEHVNEPEHSAEVGGLEDPVFDPIPEELPGESEGERESELRRENLM